jgi:transposase
MTSISVSASGPIAAASRRMRSWVQSRYRRCALGMCSATVVGRCGTVLRRCDATRLPRRKISTVLAVIPHDADMYKWRHLIDNCFQRLKEFRRIATRYDKTDTSFTAALNLVATILVLR